MATNDAVFQVFRAEDKKSFATIALNGYNISSDSTLNHVGAMRSFKILDGHVDLWHCWKSQEPLQITDAAGGTVRIRIFAAPPEVGGMGFVEFL